MNEPHNGLIHLYYGDGKGKTTCAMGLALRAAGRGMPVVVAQFLKSENSGERMALRSLPSVTLLPLPQRVKFTFRMTPEERREEAVASARRLEEAFCLANANPGLLVLDEVNVALSAGMLEEAQLLTLLGERNPALEVVLTGRNPSEVLLNLADYATELRKHSHPYDKGVAAREGIEY